MRRLLLVIMFILPILVQGVSAQDGDEQWFFAEDTEKNQVIGYNREGDIVSVMDLEDDQRVNGGWRIDSHTMLVVVEDDSDNESMVVIGPDGAAQIPYTFEYGVSAVAYHYPYVVFMPVEPRRTATPAVLINIEQATVTPLGSDAASIIEALPCCRFSDDGTSLRYVAKIQLDEDDIDLARYELRERDLETGEEQEITSVDSEGFDSGVGVSSWQPDSDGDRWLVGTIQSDEDGRIRSTWMMTLDGTATVLDETSVDASAVPIYRFWGDLMWITDARCEGGCTLDVYDEKDNVIISVQDVPEFFIQRIHYMGDGYIVAETGDAFWYMTPNSPPLIIGYKDPFTIDGTVISPDGRLIALMNAEDDGEVYFIYDSLSGETIYTRQVEDSVFIFNIIQGGFLKSNISGRIDGELRNIYVIADPEASEVVEVVFERGFVTSILSLDELLIFERDREADTQRISIYGTRAGTRSLLLEGDYFPIDGRNIADTLRY